MNSSRRIFQVHCPSCLTEFPIDSAKLPEKGVAAICSVCLRVFPVYHPRSDGHYGGVDDFTPMASAASAVAENEELIDLEIEIPETEGESEISEDPVLEELEVVSEWPGDDVPPVAIDDEAAPEPSLEVEETIAESDSEVPESPLGVEVPDVVSEIGETEPSEDIDHPLEAIEDSFSEVYEDSTEGLGGSSGDIATGPEFDSHAPEVPDEFAQESEPESDATEVLEEGPFSVDAGEVVGEDAAEEVVPESIVDEIASEYVIEEIASEDVVEEVEVASEEAADEVIPDIVFEEVASEDAIEEVVSEDRPEEGSPEVLVDPEPEVVESSAPPETPAPPAPERPVFEDLSSFTNEVLAEAESTFPPPVEKVRPAPEKVERFGRRDPHERARHLARVLVSDIIAYYPVRYQESLARRTLPEDFADEIQKSYREYVDQVGSEMAESTPYFVDALNHVLGRGEKFF